MKKRLDIDEMQLSFVFSKYLDLGPVRPANLEHLGARAFPDVKSLFVFRDLLFVFFIEIGGVQSSQVVDLR